MVDARSYITALFDEPDAASQTIPALATVGLRPDEICVAMNARETLDEFCDRWGGVPMTAPVAEQLQETGVSVERAAYCEQQVQNGRVLLLLPVSANADESLMVLRERGADARTEREEETVRIPLHAERLRINKRTVRDAEVRVRKVAAHAMQHVDIPLKREELVITKRSPDGNVQVLRIPLSHEEFEIHKQTIVTNEATIRRESSEHVQHIAEPLREERLQVRQVDSSADLQTSGFAATKTGNSSSSTFDRARENVIHMHDTSTEIRAFFPERVSAETAADELRSNGIADERIAVRDSQGAGFLDDIKRFFSGSQSGDSHERGAILLVRESDRNSVEPIIQRYGGRMEHSADAGEHTNGGTMKLHEERLNVTKHSEKEGEVRLSKDVVTTREEVDVPVKREEVLLTRRRVDEPDNDAEISDGEELRIPVMRDEVEVEKQRVTTEEVGVQKRAVDATEHVSASLEKERARLETDGKVGTTLDDRE